MAGSFQSAFFLKSSGGSNFSFCSRSCSSSCSRLSPDLVCVSATEISSPTEVLTHILLFPRVYPGLGHASRVRFRVRHPAMEADGEHLTLRDGSRVLVREVRPDDRELFVAGFDRLSEEARYRRFMAHKKRLGERELDFLTRLDHRNHEAVGAIDEETGAGVGVARMVRSEDDPDQAEAAVVVVDDWHGKGVGGLLLDRLTRRARDLGVKRFTASLFTDNRRMLALFDHLGCVQRHREDIDTVAIEVDLPTDSDDGSLATALRSAAAGEVEAVPPPR